MNMHDAVPAREPEENQGERSSFEHFLDRARAQQKATTQHAGAQPESWAEPDPKAIQRLSDTRHPIKHLYSRRSGLEASRRNFLYAVRQCSERLQGLAPRSLTMDDVYDYAWHHVDADMAADYARLIYATYDLVTTRNGCISTLRQVIEACYRAKLISRARRDEILEELPTMAPGESTRRRRLTIEEISALLSVCEADGSDAAIRDAAVIALFATTGVRVSELVAIDIDDWNRPERTVLLRSTKNGRPHTVFVHPVTDDYLRRWLQVRGIGPGALFAWSGGPTKGAPVDRDTVRAWLRRRQRQAEIAPFGSHDFRRTLASTLLRTHDIALVAKLLNHKKVSSTSVYDLATQDEQRAANDSLGLAAPTRPSEETEGPDEGIPA